MKTFDNRVNNQFATLTVFNVGWIAPFKLLLSCRFYFLCNEARVNQYLIRSQRDPLYSLDFVF